MRSRYTCLSCLLHQSRQRVLGSQPPFVLATTRTASSSSSSLTEATSQWKVSESPNVSANPAITEVPIVVPRKVESRKLRSIFPAQTLSPAVVPRRLRSHPSHPNVPPAAVPRRVRSHVSHQTVPFPSKAKKTRPAKQSRQYSSAATEEQQFIREYTLALSQFKSNLNYCVHSAPDAPKYGKENMTIEQALSITRDGLSPIPFPNVGYHGRIAAILAEHYPGEKAIDVSQNIKQLLTWHTFSTNRRAALVDQDPTLAKIVPLLAPVEAADKISHPIAEVDELDDPPIDFTINSISPDEDADPPSNTFETLRMTPHAIQPVDNGHIEVPRLSFDLSRVLFNPGVYRLQDPRSRVYNFDPYLEKIMPVTEFNFEALNKYITSSEDDTLRELALQRQKRYVGSSSSMTNTLAHFHFLISSWRSLNINTLSRGFKADSENFSRFQRSPAAIFLRHRDGVYAMDADKEFEGASILMSLGRSMEKLLTLEKSEYERLRKSNAIQTGQSDLAPEQYHYSELGPFLMRSQLDAHDPRLPGTGMFDLKTRAVVSIRMTQADARGTGYEIKHRYGTYESFEREYYDMIRSAFLKYSLQVRMGRMDGIFVAFHNIERIFGFQYISLAEMDRAIHGQEDETLGDLEFGFSVKLLTEVFDRATKTFPNQSLRFHFETRESTAKKTEGRPWMYVFAEPVSEEEIDKIQSSSEAEVKQMEERIFGSKGSTQQQAVEMKPETNTADTELLESLDDLKVEIDSASPSSSQQPKHVLGLRVEVQSRIDGNQTLRPVNLTENEKWELDFSITEMPKTQTDSRYVQVKNRRSGMYKTVRETDQAAVGYVAHLFDMSKAGAVWRKQRDEEDAVRGKVILYDNIDEKRADSPP